MWLPEKDRYTESQKRLEASLVSLMGGRAAEELIFDDVTTGAHNDIERGTSIARAMVCEYGMSKLLGPQHLGSHNQPIFLGQGISGSDSFSEETSQKIDQEVQRILTEAYDTTMKILTDNKDKLITLSELLIEREVLDFADVDSIMKTGKLPPEAAVEKDETVPETEEAPEEATEEQQSNENDPS